MKSFFLACLAFLFGGMTAAVALADPAKPEKQKTAAAFTHVIAEDAEYYTTGPQQGRPPDGTFEAGTRVKLLKKAGSYSLVRSEGGVKAYVAADKVKEATDVQPTQEETDLAQANNQFAVDLYAKLAEQEQGKNLFFSPFSVSTALAMTHAGAEGQTEQQMAQVLHLSLPEAKLHRAFAGLIKKLAAGDKRRGFQLYVANRLWGQQGFGFMPDFLDVTRTHFGAELAQVDFVRQAEQARQEINTWVEEQTQEKIKDLIPAGALDQATVLVLTNAIYFKGDWTARFDPELTQDAPFQAGPEEEVTVPLMNQNDYFQYGKVKGIQVLELPYGKKDLSMVVLLPEAKDGLAGLERNLSAEMLNQSTTGLRRQKVEVLLPKFKLESQFVLNDVLQSMGMTLPFSGDADFSGISSSERLFISAAIHKAFVDVNEEGTEAAAATAIAIGRASFQEPAVFRADHPFLFLIRDNRTGTILFMGRVVKPSQ